MELDTDDLRPDRMVRGPAAAGLYGHDVGGMEPAFSLHTRVKGQVAMPRTRGPEVTPRDIQILQWTGRHGVVTPEQVAARFFRRDGEDVGMRVAYRRVQVLETLDLLRRDRTFWRAPHVVRLTPAGARLADAGVKEAPLVLRDLEHSLALVDLTEKLLVEYPGSEIITERELRARRLRERQAGERPKAAGRTPDALLCLAGGETVAIELDLTPKRDWQYARIARAYNTERANHVWWFVTSERVAERIRRVLHQVPRAASYMEVREWRR